MKKITGYKVTVTYQDFVFPKTTEFPGLSAIQFAEIAAQNLADKGKVFIEIITEDEDVPMS